MVCAACGTLHSKKFWRCPACGGFNFRRLGWWAGMILSPWAFLALVIFRREILFLLGFSRDVYYTDRWSWLGMFFPLAGVPFLWFGNSGWMRKIGLSLAYVFFCYGLAVMAMLLFIFLAIRNWH